MSRRQPSISRYRFLSVLVALGCSCAAQTGSDFAGEISALVPKAQVTRGSGQKKADIPGQRGTALRWQDVVRTSHDGRARIQLNDQSILTLGSDSRLRIEKHDAA